MIHYSPQGVTSALLYVSMTVLVTTVLKMFMILKPLENILSKEKWFVSKTIYNNGLCNVIFQNQALIMVSFLSLQSLRQVAWMLIK